MRRGVARDGGPRQDGPSAAWPMGPRREGRGARARPAVVSPLHPAPTPLGRGHNAPHGQRLSCCEMDVHGPLRPVFLFSVCAAKKTRGRCGTLFQGLLARCAYTALFSHKDCPPPLRPHARRARVPTTPPPHSHHAGCQHPGWRPRGLGPRRRPPRGAGRGLAEVRSFFFVLVVLVGAARRAQKAYRPPPIPAACDAADRLLGRDGCQGTAWPRASGRGSGGTYRAGARAHRERG